jgi:hypothetical protein
MATVKSENIESTHAQQVQQVQQNDDSPVGQLKQIQRLFTRFKDAKAMKKRAKVWTAFEEHVRQHGETPSTRSFKARCLLLELSEDVDDRNHAKKVAAFRDYMEAAYLDTMLPQHSISGLCLHAYFLGLEYFRRSDAGERPMLEGLKEFLDAAMMRVKQHGSNFVDPLLEVMEARPTLQWEQCDAPDPRLQILHRSKWLRQQRNAWGRAHPEPSAASTGPQNPECTGAAEVRPAGRSAPNGSCWSPPYVEQH